MPYAMYLRKSRTDAEMEARGEGETLARHRVILTNLAAKNGHTIAQYYEEVVSGETIQSRPQMQQLLVDVGAGKWQGVYVMEVERLARGDVSDQGRVARTFLFSKTRIITPTKTYDPTNEFDEEYFEFALFMSRREYKTINRRIQAGRAQSIREGKYICSRPAYGYRKVKISGDKGYTLEIHPGEAAVVRQVFSWYIHGDGGARMGLTRIANRLADMHVDPGEQGDGWRPCRIHRMLTNEVYIGKIRWGYVKTERELKEDGIKKTLRMSKDYQLHDGLHSAIVDEETFATAQKRREQCDYVPLQKGKQLSNPLAGLVVCSGCGHTLRGKPAAGRQPAMLFCATHGCGVVRTSRREVENAILDALREWLVRYQVQLDKAASGQPDATASILESSVEGLVQEQETLERQKSKLHDLLEQEVYTPDMFAKRMLDLNKRSEALTAALHEAETQAAQRKASVGEDAATMIPVLRHVLDDYDSMTTATEKNELLKLVIDHVDYSKTKRGNQHVDPHQFKITLYPRVV